MAVLEVCASDLRSARAATEGGAYRIELCSALSADGVTPSAGMIARAVEICRGKVKVNVLIRPDEEPGFVIDPDTAEAVMKDIAACALAGADGVVVGALKPDRTVDEAFLVPAVRLAHGLGLTVTFHRAFDITPDPFRALETIISAGCDCILTSGQAKSAAGGTALLADLIRRADGRIEIMPGAGINPSNAATIARTTGCRIMHSSCRMPGALSSDKDTVRKIVNAITI